MTRTFVERCIFQALCAACVSFFLALALEILAPLSVSSFVNLPVIGLFLWILVGFWIARGAGVDDVS